jgi:AmmeMemoRadiSam system protein B
VVLYDPYRVAPDPLTLFPAAVEAAGRCDGTASVAEIAAAVGCPAEAVAELVAALDAGLFLDSPALHDYLDGPERRPACVGVYPADPDAVRRQLDALFTAPGGPGLPGPVRDDRPPVRAVLAPHMDYARGGVAYGWAFKELAERTRARLFVIVATSHHSPERFTLTRQHFRTPLGLCQTDRRAVDLLAAEYGAGVFRDRLAHHPEHSIELEVLLLQHVLAGREPFRIVPLLCGSFADRVAGEADPGAAADVARMAAALRKLEAEAGEPVCYLISGDLAHIGPKFRDPVPLDDARLAASKEQDERILRQLEAADPAGYFGVIAAEGDERNICGLPPTWLALAVANPSRGRVLHYQQFVHPERQESVSFAAAAFDG